MEPTPALAQINIVVRDMERAVAFYRLLGLAVEDTVAPWQPHHRHLGPTPDGVDADLDSAAFAAQWDRGWSPDRSGVVVGVRVLSRAAVDDVYATVTSQGHRGQQEPYDAFWGVRFAVVEDPDGNAIGIMSPPDESRRSGPPNPPDVPAR
jgi:catechol 2,3-dioxygenase-like lactoylglutathione lyase family enzyme